MPNLFDYKSKSEVKLSGKGFGGMLPLMERRDYRILEVKISAAKAEIEKYKAKMRVPKNELGVAILDDITVHAGGMALVLSEWQNIICETIIQEAGVNILIPQNTKILLLDEGMRGISGTEVAAMARSEGFEGLICSTSSLKTDYHDFKFTGKMNFALGNYGEFITGFVEMMNRIIEKVECG